MYAPLGRLLAGYLTQSVGTRSAATDQTDLAAVLQPGDVLLVEGDSRMSGVVKYLTQSNWSHATLYVGPRAEIQQGDGVLRELIEADVKDGVRAVPLSEYAGLRTRVCRPQGLTAEDRERVITYAIARIGHHYDLKNVLDLARYLLPLPMPRRWRRRALAFGSGDPTRAICSTLIAQAFQSVNFPILARVVRERDDECDCVREYYEIRHHSLFAPRDFDISPYFAVIKPTLARPLAYHDIVWLQRDTQPAMLPRRIGAAVPGNPLQPLPQAA